METPAATIGEHEYVVPFHHIAGCFRQQSFRPFRSLSSFLSLSKKTLSPTLILSSIFALVSAPSCPKPNSSFFQSLFLLNLPLPSNTRQGPFTPHLNLSAFRDFLHLWIAFRFERERTMSFQDLESGRRGVGGPRRGSMNGGRQDPTQAVASGIFQINTAVSTFQRLVNTLGTPKDTPELRDKLLVFSLYLYMFFQFWFSRTCLNCAEFRGLIWSNLLFVWYMHLVELLVGLLYDFCLKKNYYLFDTCDFCLKLDLNCFVC